MFYVADNNTLMAVPIEVGSGFIPSRSRSLFTGSSRFAILGNILSRNYDVTTDGQSFIVVQNAEGQWSVMTLVQNWIKEYPGR